MIWNPRGETSTTVSPAYSRVVDRCDGCTGEIVTFQPRAKSTQKRHYRLCAWCAVRSLEQEAPRKGRGRPVNGPPRDDRRSVGTLGDASVEFAQDRSALCGWTKNRRKP